MFNDDAKNYLRKANSYLTQGNDLVKKLLSTVVALRRCAINYLSTHDKAQTAWLGCGAETPARTGFIWIPPLPTLNT